MLSDTNQRLWSVVQLGVTGIRLLFLFSLIFIFKYNVVAGILYALLVDAIFSFAVHMLTSFNIKIYDDSNRIAQFQTVTNAVYFLLGGILTQRYAETEPLTSTYATAGAGIILWLSLVFKFAEVVIESVSRDWGTREEQ